MSLVVKEQQPPQPAPVFSIHLDDATAATVQRRQLTTNQLQVERRENDRANSVDGDYWEAMIDKGQLREFGQGYTLSLQKGEQRALNRK